MTEPTAEQPQVTATVSPAEPPRSRWGAIPRRLGRARTSTVVLSVLFLAIGALWINIRPDAAVDPTGGSSTVQPVVPAPATPTPTPTPEPEPVPTTAPERTPTSEAPTTTPSTDVPTSTETSTRFPTPTPTTSEPSVPVPGTTSTPAG
jgi:hypothetical protein